MPRFNVFQSFRSGKKERSEPARYDTRVPWYDSYDQSRTPTPSESQWRNVLTKRRPPRNEFHGNEPEYYEQDTRSVRHPSQRPIVEDYDSQESMTTDSENYPIRHPMPEHHTRFIERMPSYESLPPEPPGHYVSRIPSHESLSARELQSSLVQSQSGEPHFAPPADEVYMEESVAPSTRDETVARESEPPPLFHAEPRRFRARRGEPITVGNTRIEVEDDGGHDSHRRGRSRSRSTVSYDSYDSSRSYSSSSYDERPIIISADPHTQIEIGNEQDGFVPYEQYLAERESRRRRRRDRHRGTPEEEIYVVPAGANVIFVDEDGNELHRVGEFDDRYNNRRRNTSARTTRQADGSYLIEF